MPTVREYLIGLAYAVLLVAACLGVLFLAGCASGVQMNDEEAAACRNEGCAVFTERELDALVKRAAEIGYRKGWTNAVRESMGEGI
jgi:hypothetical protein